MSENNNNPKKPEMNPILSSLLDFGPVTQEISSTSDTEERLKKLVKQLDQINRRIDALSTRF